ncbi:hypothetical protein ACET3Z_025697 [Daucus carota]
MGAFQDSLRKNRNVLLYPRFFQIVLNQLLTPAERAVYPNIDNVICSFMTTRVISMLENHQNYTNNEDVVLTEAMQEFLNNQNLPPPHNQNVADPVVQDEEAPETQAEEVTETSHQVNIPESQTSQMEEEVIVEDAETSSDDNAQSEGEDSLQDNSTDSEDEVDSPAQTTAAAPSTDVMVDIDELFTNTYNPLLQSGIPSDSDNLSFSAPDWVQNLLDSNQLSPPITSANEFEIPQIYNQGTTLHTPEAETTLPLSQPLTISEREGESALSAPHKEIVSETAALSPSQESEVAHTMEELTVANTLSSMSGTDTVVSDPIQGQVPSQASGGNLDDLPLSTSLSTPLGGTFPYPLRDSSPLEGERQSVSEPFISGSVPVTEDLSQSHSPSKAVVGNQGSSDEETEDEGSRTFIAPSVTSLDEAKKISLAGTSTEAGTSLSERETLTEPVIQKPSDPLSALVLSEMRETPVERTSENPSTQPTIESAIPTVSVTEFEALKFKVQHLEAENLVLREELVEIKSTMEQRLVALEAKLLASQPSREDYSTEWERVAEKAKGKRVITGVSEELIDSALKHQFSYSHDEYIPEFLDDRVIRMVGAENEDLEEGEIPDNEVFADELAYYNDIFPTEEFEIANPQDIADVSRDYAEQRRAREKLENQRRIRRERRLANLHKDGAEWDIARSVFDFPEVTQDNDDDEVKDIFDSFRNNYKDLHDYHEVLNDIISTVSVAVLPRRGWMVNISFELQREGHGLKHVSSQFLRDLSLTELFVPSVIKYFKDGMIQSIGLTDEALSTYNPRILKYLEAQVREKCSRTSKGRLTAELLYAYRLNFAALRDLDLSAINRQPPYPLPPLNPEIPENPNAPVVTYNSTSVIFKKKKDSEVTAIPHTEIGKFSSKRIIRAVAAVKWSVVKEDKSVLKYLIDLLDFIKECKFSYAMLHAPTIYCEIVEQMWTSATYDSGTKTLSVMINNISYNINGETVRAALRLPRNSTVRVPTENEIVSMLRDMHYNGDLSNLGQILRRHMRKEWSFLCDTFIKVFSGKVSNYDAFTMSMQTMFHMLLTDEYFNICDLVLYEIVAKLGPHVDRPRNIYFARFLMIIANHLVKNLVIAQPDNTLDCWLQSKRVCSDLMRIDPNDQVPLSLPSVKHNVT